VKLVAKILSLLAGITCLHFPLQAFAQEYPNKPIRIVLPFPPGGGADVLMRPLSKKLTEILGQPILLDNRPGANGNIGAEIVAKSPADGYTLLVGNSSIPISVGLYSQLNYDPLKDLTPITLLANTPSLLATNPEFKAKTVAELIALAKKSPGQINYGSAGIGSTPHLGMEMFSVATGTKFTHIPYKGSGPAVTAAMGGEIDILITNTSTILAQVQSGKLSPLASTTATRSALLPNVPVIAETVTGFELNTWYGLFGPGGLPKPIVDKLNSAFTRALNTPEIKQQLISMAYDPAPSSPEAFMKLIRSDITLWGNVIKSTGVTAE
jgi:tripartite-type tricarboxylate transporter receptor subunit TctC